MKADLPPLLATLVDKPPSGPEWVHEAKLDGYRTLVFKSGSKVRFITRNGNDWTNTYSQLAEAVKKFKERSFVLDGEIVALDEKGIPSFNKLQNTIGRRNTKNNVPGLLFYAFDLLSLNGKSFKSKPLLERKSALKRIISGNKSSFFKYSEHFDAEDTNEVLAEMCKIGLEGVISKLKNSPYVNGRSKYWLKSKCAITDEFIIIGYRTGTDHPIGSLLMGTYDKGKLKYAGKVGTGYSRTIKKELYEKFRPLITGTSPISEKLKYKNIVWLRPRLVAEITFLSRSEDGFRHSSFLRLRPDKDIEEVHHDDTSPDTYRNEVVDYYRQISQLLLNEIKDRPLNVYICHGGLHGRCYFLRRLSKEKLKSVKSTRKPNGNFLMSVENQTGIDSLIKFGVIEFHLWGTHIRHLEKPDRIIFDLDAGEGVSIDEIRTAALTLKKLLERLDLKSFIMTSGGKGYHIHVPIKPDYSWHQIKKFAETVARTMEEDSPKLYTTSMSPARRKHRIFIDFQRNNRGHTAVAPYSLRAREKATLAVPIKWSELKKTQPDHFTLKDVKKILKRKDPWEGIQKLKQKITLFD